MGEEFSEIATDKGCPRCGGQIHLDIETPGETTVTDPLARLLDVGVDDRAIIRAVCDCPQPRVVGVRGMPVSYDSVDRE